MARPRRRLSAAGFRLAKPPAPRSGTGAVPLARVRLVARADVAADLGPGLDRPDPGVEVPRELAPLPTPWLSLDGIAAIGIDRETGANTVLRFGPAAR